MGAQLQNVRITREAVPVTVPEAPVLTAPVTEADIDAGGDSITVTWTSATNPERFVASWVFDGVTVGKTFTATGTARELTIPTSGLPAGPDVTISVVAYNDGSFSGPAHSLSRMDIMSVGNPRVITINR